MRNPKSPSNQSAVPAFLCDSFSRFRSLSPQPKISHELIPSKSSGQGMGRKGGEMEGSMGGGENGSPCEGRPPNPLSGSYRRCFSAAPLGSSCTPTLLPHSSLVSPLFFSFVFFFRIPSTCW